MKNRDADTVELQQRKLSEHLASVANDNRGVDPTLRSKPAVDMACRESGGAISSACMPGEVGSLRARGCELAEDAVGLRYNPTILMAGALNVANTWLATKLQNALYQRSIFYTTDHKSSICIGGG